jgi:hypothetical protein
MTITCQPNHSWHIVIGGMNDVSPRSAEGLASHLPVRLV